MGRLLVIKEFFTEPSTDYKTYSYPKHLTVKELEEIQIKIGLIFDFIEGPVASVEFKKKFGKEKAWKDYERFFALRLSMPGDDWLVIYGVEGLGKVFQGTKRELTLLYKK